jgi:Zn-dependent protease with chaperone function
MNFICQLQIIYWIEKNIFAKIENKGLPASPEYQKLGKECQDIIGVPKDYQVTIAKTNVSDTRADASKIVVNEDILDMGNRAVKKYVLLHESVHKKYNDVTVGILLPAISGVFGFVCCYLITNKFNILTTMSFSSITQIVTGFIAHKSLSSFSERRADTEACYALNCHKCINDISSTIKRDDYDIRSGYLSNDEINTIGLKLKEKGLVCEHHD